MGLMSGFEPDFSHGTADSVYDYAEITYEDGTVERLENSATDENYKKSISQVLQISYVPTSIRMHQDKNAFVSGLQTVPVTKLLLAPHDRNNNIVSVYFGQYSYAGTYVTMSGDLFERWCRLAASYYKSIILTSKSTGANPYELNVHELDNTYEDLSKDVYSTYALPKDRYMTHFNQVRYGLLMNQGDIGSDSILNQTLSFSAPQLNGIRMNSSFAKVFTGFQSALWYPSDDGCKARITCQLDEEGVEEFYRVQCTWSDSIDYNFKADLSFDSGTDLNYLLPISQTFELEPPYWEQEWTRELISEDYSVGQVKYLLDSLFEFDGYNLTMYGDRIIHSKTPLDRVIRLYYANQGYNYSDLHFKFKNDITLQTGANSIIVTHDGWYPLPWVEELQNYSPNVIDNMDLRVVPEDISDDFVYFDSTFEEPEDEDYYDVECTMDVGRDYDFVSGFIVTKFYSDLNEDVEDTYYRVRCTLDEELDYNFKASLYYIAPSTGECLFDPDNLRVFLKFNEGYDCYVRLTANNADISEYFNYQRPMSTTFQIDTEVTVNSNTGTGYVHDKQFILDTGDMYVTKAMRTDDMSQDYYYALLNVSGSGGDLDSSYGYPGEILSARIPGVNSMIVSPLVDGFTDLSRHNSYLLLYGESSIAGDYTLNMTTTMFGKREIQLHIT